MSNRLLRCNLAFLLLFCVALFGATQWHRLLATGLANKAMIWLAKSSADAGWSLPLLEPGQGSQTVSPSNEWLDLTENRFEQVLTWDPGNLQSRRVLGRLEVWRGDMAWERSQPELAMRHYQRALAYQPEWAAVMRVIGGVYRANGQPEMAACYLQQAIMLNPGDCSARWQLTLALTEQGRHTEAFFSATEETEICPSRAAYAQLAEGYLRQGEWQKALTCYQRSSGFGDSPGLLPWIYFGMGLAYDGLGQREQAILHWCKALEVDPGFEPAFRKLSEGSCDTEEH